MHALLSSSSSHISCLLCLVFALLILVEGFRANAVNISSFKTLQMSVCFFSSSPKRFDKALPSTNLSGSKTGLCFMCLRLLNYTSFMTQKQKGHFVTHQNKISAYTKYFLLPSSSICWPGTEGVFKEALLFCLLIESLLESHSWISLAGQSGKAWWGVARPICSGEFLWLDGVLDLSRVLHRFTCVLFPFVARLSTVQKEFSCIVFNGTSEISGVYCKTTVLKVHCWNNCTELNLFIPFLKSTQEMVIVIIHNDFPVLQFYQSKK